MSLTSTAKSRVSHKDSHTVTAAPASSCWIVAVHPCMFFFNLTGGHVLAVTSCGPASTRLCAARSSAELAKHRLL
jgi:hypothetical protein